jgi:hypothetical protein
MRQSLVTALLITGMMIFNDRGQCAEGLELTVSDIRLYLTDGFANDHVVVTVDGRKVLEEDAVTTKKLYGLAKELGPVPVTGYTARIGINVPNKGLSTEFEVDLSNGNHVPISIQDGRVKHSVEKRLGFM